MSINEIISAYNKAKETESRAKKEKERLSALILDYAGNRDFLETDSYNVMIDNRTRTGIDTKRLYSDFPDIKEVYGTTTEYKVITAKVKQAEKVSA